MSFLCNIKEPFALLILNSSSPILNEPIFRCLWKTAKVHVCADGGANHLREFDSTLTPKYVIGDFDSITPETKSHYEKTSTKLMHFSCQETTDFEKCINYLIANELKTVCKTVVWGCFDGRPDKILSSLHLLKFYEPRMPMILASNTSMAMLLPPGTNTIDVDVSWDGPTCGLLPIYGAVHCKTTGLRWDIDKELQMGTFISTSNAFNVSGVATKHRVIVENDNYVLFTCEVVSS